MQRRINRGGDAILAKRAEWIKRDHLVFERLAAIARNQAVQLVHVEDREAAVGDRPQISTAALHRHDPLRLPGQRIGQIEFRAGVSAAEIRDAQVGAEQVRAIAQQIERPRFELGCLGVVPEILQQPRRPAGR